MTIAAFVKYATQTVKDPAFGYSQGSDRKTGRWSGLDYRPGNFDCSSFSAACAYKGGFITREDLKGTWFSGNIIRRLTQTGMYYAIDVSKMSLTQLRAFVQPGDILQGTGHVVPVLDDEANVASFEADERGRKSGGRPGDQTGGESYIRKVYARSRGWSKIARPYSVGTLLGRLLAQYEQVGFTRGVTAGLLERRAPWDGPHYLRFFKTWQELDQGLQMHFDPAKLDVPDEGHVFVVLGSALKADGSMTAKFARRLDLAVAALQLNPESKVLVTGGAPRGGITEAEAGRNYLAAKGIDPARILVEEKSSSTVGNALNSVPILAQHATSYTIVSDASHVRRAQIEFLAAQTKQEAATNKKMMLRWTEPLAHNDYGTAPVKSMAPVSKSTRSAVVKEVAYLLGVQPQYEAARS